MLTHPSFIGDEAIAHAVGAHWLPEVADISYLPWGFGAHHWRVTAGGTTVFVTLDQLEPRHSAISLEAAYAGAAALAASGSAAVCAPLPARSGRFTVDIGVGALSVTPWLEGRSPSAAEAREPRHIREIVLALTALHRADPPDGLRSWTPRVGPEFADEMRIHTAEPWTSGPLAEQARLALAAHGDAIERWTGRYLELADVAFSGQDSWVPTHGEPHNDNQVMTAEGLRLVDWESLALAPPERDYADLLPAATGLLLPDPAMVELFALDWRLSEIAEYARWFAAPHIGSEDDHTALEGLFEELAGDAQGHPGETVAGPPETGPTSA
ncbi:phosphotransferase [Nocardia sp. NBC_01329]|uniref:phosphotransferase n=1 Tax=Nocardia sp. NBC_01329 TaxID=2903594 RepID=UPI002E0F3D45|nr:aminoglycoside phosphotransferase family protein [Nocardia sp. NBC_01329]